MPKDIVNIVYRKDMLFESCVVCVIGTYTWPIEETDEVVCNRCDDVISRWVTKKEILKHGLQNNSIKKS